MSNFGKAIFVKGALKYGKFPYTYNLKTYRNQYNVDDRNRAFSAIIMFILIILYPSPYTQMREQC